MQSKYPIFFSDIGADKRSSSFTIRTQEWRYTEWIPFTATSNLNRIYHWDRQPLARELYNIGNDFFEEVNLAERSAYNRTMNYLSMRIKLRMKRQ